MGADDTAAELRDLLVPPAPPPPSCLAEAWRGVVAAILRDLPPGFYPGLTYSEYASIDAVRHSSLREMARSPLHYKHAIEHPREDTDAFLFGRLVHTAALEPHLLTDEYVLAEQGIRDYVLWEHGDRKGNAWKVFEAAHADRAIYKPGELVGKLAIKAKVERIAQVLHADPVAGPLLSAGHREGVLVWVDRRTGLRCKARIDHGLFLSAAGCVVDLKSDSKTDGLDFARFGWTTADYFYHSQAAFYLSGLKEVLQVEPPFSICAVEGKEPHDVVVFDLGEEELNIGRARYEEWLDKLAVCRKTNLWPGRANGGRVPLRLPERAYPREDDLTELGLEP